MTYNKPRNIIPNKSETQSQEKTLYTLITYGGGSTGGVKCSASTFNPGSLLSMLPNIKPGGGGLEDKTHLIDALSIALTLLCKYFHLIYNERLFREN